MMDGNNYEKLCGIGDKAEVREISEYVGTICGQIRWKKARRLVAQEIRAHIEDQRDAYLAEGLSEGEAARRAVESMGDPVAAGFHICRKQKSSLIRLLSISILATLTLQAVLYMSVNLGVTSSMITALPLMSGGAVMLMTDAALIGFLLSLFRTEELYAG